MILKELRIKVGDTWHFFGTVKFDEIEYNEDGDSVTGEAKVYSSGELLE